MTGSGKALCVGLILTIFILGFFLLRRLVAIDLSRQPIAFNHHAHVVKGKMDCSFCHEYYSNQAAAGLPSIQTCRTCHSGVQTDNPEVKKIFAYWEKHEEIPWVRLYEMPDHVTFTHKRHVRVGISCSVCHGKIGESARSSREVNHTMGSCIECHKAKRASVDCWTCHK